jgi:hypothetical protein
MRALCFLLLVGLMLAKPAHAINETVPPPIVLTDGATITVPCPGPLVPVTYYLTLTGNNHQILFPPACPVAANGLSVKFRINAGNNSGSPYTGLSFGSGYNWALQSPYAICTGTGVPNVACPAAEIASQIDWFGCDVVGTSSSSTEWDCWTPQYAVSPPIVAVAGATNSCGSSNGTLPCTTSATNMMGVNHIVGCLSYYIGAGGSSVFSDSLGNTYTQVYSAAQDNVTGVLLYVQAPTVSTSMTFTASASGTTAAPALTVMGFANVAVSPLDQSSHAGVGNIATIQPGSITPTQANELLVSCLAVNSTQSGIGVSSPFTAGPILNGTANHQGVAEAYQIQTPGPTAENPTWTWTTLEAAMAGQASFK